MIKYIVIVLLLVASIYISLYIDRQYKYRYIVYRDLEYVLNVFSSEILFKKNTFFSVLDKVREHISSFTYHLIYDYKDSQSITYTIKKNDYIEVYNYLDGIGGGDIDYEMSSIKYYINVYKNMSSTYKADYDKNGKVYSKIILVLGIAVGILLL